jgi:hypothetical protein
MNVRSMPFLHEKAYSAVFHGKKNRQSEVYTSSYLIVGKKTKPKLSDRGG